MNAEVKAIWLEALKSGKYRKARSQMASKTGYCCLGVLAMEYARVHNHTAYPNGVQGTISLSTGDRVFGLTIGVPIEEWSGVDPDTCAKLARLNDTKPGFPIQYIEENL